MGLLYKCGSLGIGSAGNDKTSGDLTIYVRSTGNDNNDGLTVATAVKELSEALSRVPRNITGDDIVTIDAQEQASFNGFSVSNFMVDEMAMLNVKFLIEQPTLTTGTATGTATGGFFSSLVDTGNNWTANELVGMVVEVNGVKNVVRFNTSDTINFASLYPFTTSGKDYEILQPKTTINSLNDDSDACVKISGCKCASADNIMVENLVIQAPASAPAGVLMQVTDGASFKNCNVFNSAGGGSIGISVNNVYSPYSLQEVYIDSNWGKGVLLENNSSICTVFRGYFSNIAGNGVTIDNTGNMLDTQIYVESCSDTGIVMVDCLSIDMAFVRSVSSTGHGMSIENCAVNISDLGGSGNSLYGVNLLKRVYMTVSGIPTITGTSGNATDDRGVSSIVWSTDLASDGDITSNPDYLITVERDD